MKNAFYFANSNPWELFTAYSTSNIDQVHLKYMLAGMLYRDYILNPHNKPALDVAGGQLLYTAAGVGLWDGKSGLISRVGENYPKEWLSLFETRGFDTRGIQITPDNPDLRSFVAYTPEGSEILDNPLSVFANWSTPFPKGLLGYVSPERSADRRVELSSLKLKLANIPPDYFDVSAAHVCPLTYDNQISLSALMQNRNISAVTMEAGPYMDALYWDQMPALVKGLAAFHISETAIRQLFLRRSDDLWQMAEGLAYYGCENIVIFRGLEGQWLYNSHAKERWEIPFYPARIVEPRGASSVFCGGYLAGYRNTYEPLTSVLYGNIAASLSVEGTSPFYCIDALPDLAKARLETLRGMMRKL